ncbi:MAG: hypothetical protein ACE14L_05765 [Terriglobales bacterium]
MLTLLLGATAWASDLTVPQRATANTAVTIGTSGSGEATLYVVGPAARIKQKVELGKEVTLKPQQVTAAGRYTVILRNGGETVTRSFMVDAGPAARVNFLAQPSRVPTGVHNVISGTAFVMDANNNLMLAPTPVRFELAVPGTAAVARTVTTKDGVAWTRMDSSKRAGNAEFTAAVGETVVRRVVQQTAADPCNLRFKATPSKNGIRVQTDPVRDCSGNPVPDGTIVTFTSVSPEGKSTVDARVKRGIAQAEFPAAPQATITVASGVVLGNEVHWGGGR